MTPYVSTVTQAEFDAALARSRRAGMLYLVAEVGAIGRYVKAVLTEEGYEFFSLRKRRRAKALFEACDAEVRRRIDLRGFFLMMSLGSVSVVDPVRDARDRERRLAREAREDAERAEWSAGHVRDNRTGLDVTRDEASMRIAFGRARSSDFGSL